MDTVLQSYITQKNNLFDRMLKVDSEFSQYIIDEISRLKGFSLFDKYIPMSEKIKVSITACVDEPSYNYLKEYGFSTLHLVSLRDLEMNLDGYQFNEIIFTGSEDVDGIVEIVSCNESIKEKAQLLLDRFVGTYAKIKYVSN